MGHSDKHLHLKGLTMPDLFAFGTPNTGSLWQDYIVAMAWYHTEEYLLWLIQKGRTGKNIVANLAIALEDRMARKAMAGERHSFKNGILTWHSQWGDVTLDRRYKYPYAMMAFSQTLVFKRVAKTVK